MSSTYPEKVKVGSDTPNITAVRADKGRCLVITWKGGVITWKGGSESVVDVAPHLAEYAVVACLRSDDDMFRKVKVGEWGWCAHRSEEMEFSADTLWRLVLEQGAAWLRVWRAAHRMTEAGAAKTLGVSTRISRYYEAGVHLLPKTVRLAGIGLDAQARAA